MVRKLISIGLVGILGWLTFQRFVTSTDAQGVSTPVPVKLAVVDMEKVFNEYQRTKDVNKKIAERQKEIRAKMKEMLEKIEALKSELQNFHPDSKDYYERQKKLFKLSVELDSFKRISTEDMKREFRLMTESIYNEIIDAVAQISADRGYDLVLYRDTVKIQGDSIPALLERIRQRKVLYASKEIDITEQVLSYINQRYKLKK